MKTPSSPVRDASRVPGGKALEIRGLTAGYAGTTVVRGVDLSVAPGEVVTLLGRNGVGKTTLVSAVSGTLGADAGVTLLGGLDATDWSGSRRRRGGLRVVAQDRPVLGGLTVAENLRLAGIRDLSEPAELFPFLRGRERQRAGTLSGGEQKMLAIARTVAAPGAVCVFDEPTEGLQPANVDRLAEALRQLAAAGVAVLLVEQYLDMALDVADRWYLMEKGQITEEGQVHEGILEHVAGRMAP
ncbi:ABC transporter ATP-binding protein [Streptomyces sp. NPDC000345]|uniref:ABC transporter ATP-binding protein n=1 Tax=Streptomyces sp. NPDC000345 TaxID=3364537 RepID=UPI0036AD0816